MEVEGGHDADGLAGLEPGPGDGGVAGGVARGVVSPGRVTASPH